MTGEPEKGRGTEVFPGSAGAKKAGEASRANEAKEAEAIREAEGVGTAGPGLALDCAGEIAWAGLQLGPGSRDNREGQKGRGFQDGQGSAGAAPRVVELPFDPRADSAAEKIDELLRAQGLAAADLQHLAVGTGPGAYTSTRGGVAAMQGLACATGLPLRAVRSDRAAAAQLGMDSGVPRALVATLPARGQSWHFWLYDAGSDKIAEEADWYPLVQSRIPKFCIDAQNSPQDLDLLRDGTGADWVVAEPGGPMRALFALAVLIRPLPPELVQPHYAGAPVYRRRGEAPEQTAGTRAAQGAREPEGAADAAG